MILVFPIKIGKSIVTTANMAIGACQNVTCQNGGKCLTFSAIAFRCDCIACFSGSYCDISQYPSMSIFMFP